MRGRACEGAASFVSHIGYGRWSTFLPTVRNPVCPTIRCEGRTERPLTDQSRIMTSNVDVSMKHPASSMAERTASTWGTLGT